MSQIHIPKYGMEKTSLLQNYNTFHDLIFFRENNLNMDYFYFIFQFFEIGLFTHIIIIYYSKSNVIEKNMKTLIYNFSTKICLCLNFFHEKSL